MWGSSRITHGMAYGYIRCVWYKDRTQLLFASQSPTLPFPSPKIGNFCVPEGSRGVWPCPAVSYVARAALTGQPLPGTRHTEHALLAYRLFAKAGHSHGAHQEADKHASGHEHQSRLPRGREHERVRGQPLDGERSAVLVEVDLLAPVVDADGRTAVHLVVQFSAIVVPCNNVARIIQNGGGGVKYKLYDFYNFF